MSSSAAYASSVNSFSGTIATSKTNDRANGSSANLVALATTGANGTRFDQILFTAVGTTTTPCQVLLFRGASAAAAVFCGEVSIPQQSVSNSSPAASALWIGPQILKGETFYAALTVSPGVAIAYGSRIAGDF